MKTLKKAGRLAAVVLSTLVLLQSTVWMGTDAALDRFFLDLFHVISGPRYEPQHVVLVTVDDRTLKELTDEPLAFWGPHFAVALQRLREAGATAVGLDFIFQVTPEQWLKRVGLGEQGASRTYDAGFRKELAQGATVLVGILSQDESDQVQVVLPPSEYLYSLPGGAGDVGLINLFPDRDGVVRYLAAAVHDEEEVLPRLSLAVLLAQRWSETSGQELSLPEDQWQSLLPIRFAGPPGTFPRLSFADLLTAPGPDSKLAQQVKGKIVLLGAGHTGMQDFHFTPYSLGVLGQRGQLMAGTEIHANMIETLISGIFPKPLPVLGNWLLALLLAALCAAWFLRLRPMVSLLLGAGLSLTVLAAAYAAFLQEIYVSTGLLLPAIPLVFLASVAVRLTGEERARVRLHRLFGRYVSPHVVDQLVSSGRTPNLGGETVEMTVLFSDIRNFTTISETLDAQEVVEMLNEYFSRICARVLELGGTIDKFIGDAIMVLFGYPLTVPDHAAKALQAALAIREEAEGFAQWMAHRFQDKGDLPGFAVGIGVHTGKAVAGNIGSAARMEFTAIGDTVNTASRLEGLTKAMGAAIVVSKETLDQAAIPARTGQSKQAHVKGRTEPVQVFEFLGFEDLPTEDGVEDVA